MIKASDIQKGTVISHNSAPYICTGLEVKTPSARGAATIYKFRFRNMLDKSSLQKSCKGDDSFEEIECQKCQLQYLYADKDSVTFMDSETYVQYVLPREDISEQLGFIKEGDQDITGLVSDEKLLTVQPPSSVTLQIVETPPAMKAASASARTKPAILETGITVQVPEYIEQGETIVVNTETMAYISRAG
jgi:elongation factor P